MPVARRLAGRHEVTGVDPSPVQVARARELVPDATFVCADMTAVTLPDEDFAAVVCLFALIHLPLAEQSTLLRAVRKGYDLAASFLRRGHELSSSARARCRPRALLSDPQARSRAAPRSQPSWVVNRPFAHQRCHGTTRSEAQD